MCPGALHSCHVTCVSHQVHLCYASGGPMNLAATLIGSSGDCLKQQVSQAPTHAMSHMVALYTAPQTHACFFSRAEFLTIASAHYSPQFSGADVLCNPEPCFFILGSKSYGRCVPLTISQSWRARDLRSTSHACTSETARSCCHWGFSKLLLWLI
jgi:hypothetical protein